VFAGVRFLGLQRSDDYGASWAARNTGFTSLQVTGTVSAGGSTVFASTLAAGVFRSDDGGMNWAAYNAGLPDLNVYGLQIDPARPYRLYALTEKAGLQMIDISAGSGWMQAAAPSAGLSAASSSSAPFPPGDPLRLPDPLPDTDADQPDVQAEAFTMPLLSMTYAPSNPALAYIGTSGAGVYRSTNGGAPGTWQASGLSGKTVRSLAVPPGNSAVVYAATTEVGAVQVSSNSGANWSPSALPGLAVYALATSPHEPDAVFAGSSDGLWKKSGASWSRLGLAGRTVTAVAAHPARPGVLLAGTTGGAYYSGDNGVNCVPLSSELAPFTVSAFTFLPTDEAHVLVGTTTRSTVRVRLP
jgi:WD40 repeat protein